MDKEIIKQLFSIGIESKATHALDIKITSQPAILPEIAELFHNPEVNEIFSLLLQLRTRIDIPFVLL